MGQGVMPMLYPQELIEEIRMQNDIVDVVSQYLPLKQKGSSYFGLCPFHHEKSASFSVNSEKQFYYCFGCGAAGNVFGFMMQMENCDFVEAVKRLADRVNIVLPEPQMSVHAKAEEEMRQRVFALHKTAGRFYYEKLQEQGGKEARLYLEKRQVSPQMQKKFGLGYSPRERQALFLHLQKEGYSITEMLKSGLVMENKEKDGYHDRFYNRLMFPIFDVQGRAIGFGGRILGKGEPKYLNSPETIIFSKSKNLYGLNFAKQERKKQLILVEGYMDMLSLYQAGFHNVVAALGTAFNQEHVKALQKYAEEIILLYDSDDAGTNAALRAIPILVAGGFRVRVLQVPNGKDPDEFIKQEGSLAFRKLLLEAVHYISFQIACIKREYYLENLDQRVLFTREAAKILAKLDSDIERDGYIGEVARMTGIAEEAIKSEVKKMRQKDQGVFIAEAEKKRLQRFSQERQETTLRSKGIFEAQQDMVFLGATNVRLYEKLKKVLEPSDFVEEVYGRAWKYLEPLYEKNGAIFPGELVSFFQEPKQQQMVTAVFATQLAYETPQDMEKALNEEVKLIKRAKIDKMAAGAVSIEDIQKLLEAKRLLEELYITVSDG